MWINLTLCCNIGNSAIDINLTIRAKSCCLQKSKYLNQTKNLFSVKMTSLLKLYRFAPVRSMFAINKMNKSSVTHWLPSTMRCFSDDTKSSKDDKEAAIEKKRIVQSNYVPLSESNATIILDVEEEREKLKSGGPFNDNYDDHQYDAFEGLNADRKFIVECTLPTINAAR